MKDTLDLVLKEKWYRMIESGEKTEEYREIKPYWIRRLTELKLDFLPFSYRNGYQTIPFKDYDRVIFHLGYAKNRPSMTFDLDKIMINKGKPEWGAEEGKLYFVIYLGQRLS